MFPFLWAPELSPGPQPQQFLANSYPTIAFSRRLIQDPLACPRGKASGRLHRKHRSSLLHHMAHAKKKFFCCIKWPLPSNHCWDGGLWIKTSIMENLLVFQNDCFLQDGALYKTNMMKLIICTQDWSPLLHFKSKYRYYFETCKWTHILRHEHDIL